MAIKYIADFIAIDAINLEDDMTDHDQGAFEAALQADLAAARQQNLVLADQLREANTLNEGLAYKLDYMHREVAKVTASREQFERVSIRVATLAESVATVAIKQLEEIRGEIRKAAFGKVPGAVQVAPAEPAGEDSGYIDDMMRGEDFELPIEALDAIRAGEYSELPPLGDSRRMPKSLQAMEGEIRDLMARGDPEPWPAVGIPKGLPGEDFSLEQLGKFIGAANIPEISAGQVAHTFRAGFDSASLLPSPRLGNGEWK
jgi:hypothetical protein